MSLSLATVLYFPSSVIVRSDDTPTPDNKQGHSELYKHDLCSLVVVSRLSWVFDASNRSHSVLLGQRSKYFSGRIIEEDQQLTVPHIIIMQVGKHAGYPTVSDVV